MSKLIKFILLGAAFFLISTSFGILAAIAALAVVLITIIVKKRANILSYLASQAYYIRGDAEKGKKYFEKAYKSGDMLPRGKISYSSFCLREGDYDRAKRLLNEVINSRNSDVTDKNNARHNMAVVLWREGKLDEAIEMIDSVHEKMPSTNTYGTAGVLHLERAKRQDAEAELPFMLEAYEYNGDDKTIADNLGELYYIMGEYEKACEVYEELDFSKIITPMPYYNYGRTLAALGKKEEAADKFKKALSLKFTSVITVTPEMVREELQKLE